MTFLAKICGLKTFDAIETALDHGATHLGFIFFEKSPRHISQERARDCVRHAEAYADETGRARAQSVAVTVNASMDLLADIIAEMQPDMLQLHGSETPARAKAILHEFGLPLIKAFAVREATDLAQIDAYKDIVDLFLFDAKPPKGSDLPGGNGVSFDWSLLSGLDPSVEYMLSGGLHAGNIAEALAIANPPGIDMSSGVESAPGIKDPAMIAEFLKLLPLKN